MSATVMIIGSILRTAQVSLVGEISCLKLILVHLQILTFVLILFIRIREKLAICDDRP